MESEVIVPLILLLTLFLIDKGAILRIFSDSTRLFREQLEDMVPQERLELPT
tara:strand:- start:10 stop:165 length:156 start_codon:yes stop_codon:yes gene_type:complete